jgi:hypothetical protein
MQGIHSCWFSESAVTAYVWSRPDWALRGAEAQQQLLPQQQQFVGWQLAAIHCIACVISLHKQQLLQLYVQGHEVPGSARLLVAADVQSRSGLRSSHC